MNLITGFIRLIKSAELIEMAQVYPWIGASFLENNCNKITTYILTAGGGPSNPTDPMLALLNIHHDFFHPECPPNIYSGYAGPWSPPLSIWALPTSSPSFCCFSVTLLTAIQGRNRFVSREILGKTCPPSVLRQADVGL